MSAIPHRAVKTLEERLGKAITKKVKSGIRDLAITSDEKRVVIHGRASSYYLAQLALSAAQEVLRSAGDQRPLRTKIVVDPLKP